MVVEFVFNMRLIECHSVRPANTSTNLWAAFFVLQAAISGEKWEPILPRTETRKAVGESIKQPPQNPPPRPPAEMRRKRAEDLEGAAYDNPIKVSTNDEWKDFHPSLPLASPPLPQSVHVLYTTTTTGLLSIPSGIGTLTGIVALMRECVGMRNIYPSAV